MEGPTPPQKPRPPGRPVVYPFEQLKPGESFLVSLEGLSRLQARRKFHNLRTRKWKMEQKLSCSFTLTPDEEKNALRVRREG